MFSQKKGCVYSMTDTRASTLLPRQRFSLTGLVYVRDVLSEWIYVEAGNASFPHLTFLYHNLDASYIY